MTSDPYNEAVRACFNAPAHAGKVAVGTAVSVDDQGVRIELSAATRDDFISELGFRAWGCPHVIAATELFCRDFENQPVAALATFSARQIMQTLSVPVEKTGRILVLEDAVRALGNRLREAS